MFDFQFPYSRTPEINSIIENGAKAIREEDFILKEIKEFLASQKRRDMLLGQDYYCGNHDILRRKRMGIGPGGKQIEIENLPNNRIVDNQYKKLVTQKMNYILGKPITFDGDNSKYIERVKDIFDDSFGKVMRNVCEDSLNCGMGWLYVHYDDRGRLRFRRFRPWEIIPGWTDEDHRELDYVIRIYDRVEYRGSKREVCQCVEVYDRVYIKRYIIDKGRLVPDGTDWRTAHFYMKRGQGSFGRVPIVPFKYNDKEIPLIKMVKTLQDGLNLIVSNFLNAMEEDPRNTILVLKNYDGENLGEFRKNLASYGAVKVRTIDGAQGGVDTLSINVNAENYKSLIEIFKKSIIENGMGYDAKDDRLSGNPNQMNIQSMYSDIDLDTNGIEREYRYAFEELLWFVNMHISNTGAEVYDNEKVNVIFNRDILINESEAIDSCIKSMSILSRETIVAQHPWTDDVEKELERIRREDSRSLENEKRTSEKEKSDNDEKVSGKAGA